ncbi:S8 family peptidase [Bacillus pumilus]|uniref:S8 family peptidase n=1 Tax=Bacillus pumilus TaxID=1408 RepID=UPI001F0F9252|nr:S8 family serine peptidase [Bacillus pumilus]
MIKKTILICLCLLYIVGCEKHETTKFKLSKANCDNNWAICMIFPDKKIEITKTQPVKIAVLDSGIEQNIPQIKKHIKNTYNAIDRTSETKPFSPHGTMIASILTNTQIKNTKIGITENINLYDVQVLDEHGKGDPSDTIEGIEWSIKQGVDIINLSFGFAKDDSRLKAAIEKAHLKGILIVASAGNNLGLSTDYPAKYENVISISAVDKSKKIFAYAGQGKIDFVAPGVNVPVINTEGSIEIQSGTSFATAYASGVISLFIQNGLNNKEEIINRAEKLGEISIYGNGLIQYKN